MNWRKILIAAALILAAAIAFLWQGRTIEQLKAERDRYKGMQTVAALPHITTGSYTLMLEELEAMDVLPEFEACKARAKAMDVRRIIYI